MGANQSSCDLNIEDHFKPEKFIEKNIHPGYKPLDFKNEACFPLDEHVFKSTPFSQDKEFLLRENEGVGDRSVIKEEKVFGNEEMRKQIENPRIYPFCCIGIVSGKIGGRIYYGTGFLIGPSLVLTCAHNCEDKGTPATEMQFTPAANGKNGKSYRIAKAHYEKQKFQNRYHGRQYDYAILEIQEDLSKEYGYLGINISNNNLQNCEKISICGYPGDKDQKTMWTAEGNFVHEGKFIIYMIPTYSGQSGAPVICQKTKNVVGIHLGSVSSSNKALKLTPQIKDFVNRSVNSRFGEVGSLDLKKQKISNVHLPLLIDKWEPKVKRLILQNNQITHEGIKIIFKGTWQHLITLKLGQNKIGNQGIIELGSQPKLKSLSLICCGITSEGVKYLSQEKFPSLTYLNLTQNYIRDEGLQNMNLPSLQELWAQNCAITDEGLKHLSQKQLPNLREINFNTTDKSPRMNKITKSSLEEFKKFNLEELKLRGSNIPEDEILKVVYKVKE